jgi:hypothetical protein
VVTNVVEAVEKHEGINEFAAGKFLGAWVVSIFRVAVPALTSRRVTYPS